MLAFRLAVPLLARLPPTTLSRVLPLISRPGRRARRSPAHVAEIVGRVERALALRTPLAPATCLTRGFSRFFFLRRAGIDVALAFGVGRTDAAYTGHCWLELDGAPILERSDPRPAFVEFFRIPESVP